MLKSFLCSLIALGLVSTAAANAQEPEKRKREEAFVASPKEPHILEPSWWAIAPRFSYRDLKQSTSVFSTPAEAKTKTYTSLRGETHFQFSTGWAANAEGYFAYDKISISGNQKRFTRYRVDADIDYAIARSENHVYEVGLGADTQRIPYLSVGGVNRTFVTVESAHLHSAFAIFRATFNPQKRSFVTLRGSFGMPFMLRPGGIDGFTLNGGLLFGGGVHYKYYLQDGAFLHLGVDITYDKVNYTNDAPFTATSTMKILQEAVFIGLGMFF